MLRIPTIPVPAPALALVLAGCVAGGATALAEPPPTSAVTVDVPLPVSRPVRVSQAGPVAMASSMPAPDRRVDEGGGSGRPLRVSALKSGSVEALAVQLEGAKVVSSDGTIVGEVERVVDGPASGPQAVLSVGGFLGIGERHVAVPADSLVPSDKEMVRSLLTEAELRGLPEYTE